MSKEGLYSKETLAEAIRFAFVGGFATLLHWIIYEVLLPWCNAYAAYAVGYTLSFLANFLATSYITFRTRPTWTRLWGMAGAHAVNFGVHFVLLAAMLRLGVPERLAPIPVFCVAVPINFLLVKFVFKKTKERQ